MFSTFLQSHCRQFQFSFSQEDFAITSLKKFFFFLLHFSRIFFISKHLVVMYMDRDIFKNQKALDEMSQSMKEFLCLDDCFCLLFLLSNHSECRVCPAQ